MANTIVGQVLSLGPIEEITTRTGTVMPRQALMLAARRFDPITGEPTTDFANTPELVFMGRNASELCGVREGDIVSVSFEISGRGYVDSQGRKRIITDIRPYRLEIRQHAEKGSKAVEQRSSGEISAQEPQPRGQNHRQAPGGYPQRSLIEDQGCDPLPF